MIKGVLNLHIEQGCGGWWAIQDERFIREDPTIPGGGEAWSYDGLHSLEDGDYLRIYSPDGSVYWEGHLYLKDSEGNYNKWEHCEVIELERKFWGTPFILEYKGELYKNGEFVQPRG